MSTQKKSKKKKKTLPTPPPRTRSVSPAARKKNKTKLTPIITNSRTRSRSAHNKPKAPDHPSPTAPPRNKSRNGRGYDLKCDKKKLPTPKPSSKTGKKPKPPKTNSTSNFHAKQLPDTPTRVRAHTTIPQSASQSKKKKLSSEFIDNRPSLKPSISKHMDEKENTTPSNSNSKPPPPPRNSGHHRDYSIVKSVPLIFKNNLKQLPPNPSKKKRQFGLKPPPRKNKNKGFATASDKREGIMSASCQCGAIVYELLSLPQELQHCYCSMCRKMHGSSSATWSPFLEQDIRFIKDGTQTKYKSSENVTRSFCSVCGANVSLKYTFQTDTIWITPSLFDGAKKKYKNEMDVKTWWLNVRILHIFCASKCEWIEIPNDGHPQLSQSDIQNSEINGEPRFMYNKELPPKPVTPSQN